ncbi:MAG TPA: efflux transporter outer membrane subunit [Candidatus Udaeobacter sp.]|nr:efflux transporter outer membrane subunit [Candidatus Udaeobacter sp.]
MRKHFLSSTVLGSLVLSACSLAPDFQRPQMAVPDGWSSVPGIALKSQQNPSPFWEDLGSEDLTRVMKVALAQNLDLTAALHRIEQARAQVKVAGAPLYPSLDASGGTSRSFQDPVNVSAARGLGSINYELDLWGKNRNQKAAASYRADATQHDRDALRLIVSADTAAFYTQVLSLNERIRIAESNLKNAEEVLRIIEARYRTGSVSGLEVSQQRVAVNGLRAALTSLAEQRATAANALAILLGQAPQNLQAPKASLASLKLPEVSLTPPASLLTARPDIAGAEAGLKAANADIGSARAAFFPSVTLGTDASIAAGFGNPAASAVSLASNILAPIFTGGRLTGNLENVTARQKELAAQYQKTVLIAFQEVEDALAALKSNNEQALLSRESVNESQNAYDIAKARFDAGAIDYLTLLETQRSLYQAQDNQILVNEGQIEAFIQLRKALGA